MTLNQGKALFQIYEDTKNSALKAAREVCDKAIEAAFEKYHETMEPLEKNYRERKTEAEEVRNKATKAAREVRNKAIEAAEKAYKAKFTCTNGLLDSCWNERFCKDLVLLYIEIHGKKKAYEYSFFCKQIYTMIDTIFKYQKYHIYNETRPEIFNEKYNFSVFCLIYMFYYGNNDGIFETEITLEAYNILMSEPEEEL